MLAHCSKSSWFVASFGDEVFCALQELPGAVVVHALDADGREVVLDGGVIGVDLMVFEEGFERFAAAVELEVGGG